MGTDFSQATLTGADLSGADLAGATFEQASMAGADLADVSAAGADLSQVDLSGDSLRGAVLPDADLSQDQLRQADLAGADLQGAQLDQADTTRADLAGADLQGASLVQVTDTGAIVRGARGLTPVNSIGGVLAVLFGLISLRTRWLRGPPAGRAAALLASAVLLAAGAYLINIATGFRPTVDTGFLIPIVWVPGLLAGLLLVRAVRRVASAMIAAVLAIAGALGFYLLLSAAVAYIADPATDITAYAEACNGPSCLGGMTRGLTGAAAGLVLLVLVLAVSRLTGIRRPGEPSRFRWVVTSGGGAGW